MTTDDKNNVQGESRVGDDEVLIHTDDNLIEHTSWYENGYTVAPFLSNQDYQRFYSGFLELFARSVKKAGLTAPSDFHPQHYHQLIGDDYEAHLSVVEQTKLYDAEEFPIAMDVVEDRVSELLGVKVKSIKPFNQERVFHFRVIRPGAHDYNPLHRDVWQDENRGAVNIYVPLCGSNERSSLLLAPSSHLWPEKEVERTIEGARMNGIRFNVPGLVAAKKELNLVRPNPGENEMLLFTPYTIHGLSANENKDVTRISLEMRFWRA